MGTWIKTDGRAIDVTPLDGQSFSLQEIQSMVGDICDVLRTRDGKIMYVHDEGLLLNLPRNFRAEQLVDPARYNITFGLRGDVLVCEKGETD